MIRSTKEVSTALKATIAARMAAPTDVWGIPFGFSQLDIKTGGIHTDTAYTVLASRPGVGKTALSLKWTLHVSRWLKVNQPGKVVRYVTLEMSPDALQHRLACMLAELSNQKVLSGNLTSDQFRRYEAAQDELAGLPIEYWTDSLNTSGLLSFIKRNDNCAWWILDHAGILDDATSTNQPTAALALVSKRLAQICHKVAPGLVITHLNRLSDLSMDKRPTLSGIQGSDQFAKDADLVLAPFRPDMHEKKSADQVAAIEAAELHVLKNRNGAAGYYIKMLYNGARTEWDEDDDTEADNG